MNDTKYYDLRHYKSEERVHGVASYQTIEEAREELKWWTKSLISDETDGFLKIIEITEKEVE